jgi:hypothetical protein
MLSWYPNSTLHCILPMQPSQLIKFSNFESKPPQRHKRLNSNYFTRRTSGQCLGTFKTQIFPFCYPFLAVTFTATPPPLNFISISLFLSQSGRSPCESQERTKREPSVWDCNWAIPFLGAVNTGTWPSRLRSLESGPIRYGHESCWIQTLH